MKYRAKQIVFLALAILLWGNPSERIFIQKVSDDFGQMHGGMRIELNDLLKIGDSSYRSYYLFSLYSYQFGNIQVNYFGLAFVTFYLGSEGASIPEKTLST